MINNGKVITDSLEEAEALNNQFYSVFTDEDLFDLPQLDQLEHPMMPEISFSISGIHSLLLNLDSNKSPGPDSMTTIFLKRCADEVSPILQVIFTQSMNSGTLPDDCFQPILPQSIKRMTELMCQTTGLFHLLQSVVR